MFTVFTFDIQVETWYFNSGFTRRRRGSGEQQGPQRRECRGRGFTQAAPLSVPLSLPVKWASTSANLAVQCRVEPTLQALFFPAAISASGV